MRDSDSSKKGSLPENDRRSRSDRITGCDRGVPDDGFESMNIIHECYCTRPFYCGRVDDLWYLYMSCCFDEGFGRNIIYDCFWIRPFYCGRVDD